MVVTSSNRRDVSRMNAASPRRNFLSRLFSLSRRCFVQIFPSIAEYTIQFSERNREELRLINSMGHIRCSNIHFDFTPVSSLLPFRTAFVYGRDRRKELSSRFSISYLLTRSYLLKTFVRAKWPPSFLFCGFDRSVPVKIC